MLGPGMLTQGGKGGRAAPLASRLHRIPTRVPLSLHGISWELPTFGPPWLSERYHPRLGLGWNEAFEPMACHYPAGTCGGSMHAGWPRRGPPVCVPPPALVYTENPCKRRT
jgi:hypothetical protein